MGKVYLSQINFNNYAGARTISIKAGFPENYIEELSLDNSNNVYLSKIDKYAYGLYTNNLEDEFYLNANLSGLCRELTVLSNTDLLNKEKANYHFVTNMHTAFANCYSLAGTPISAKRIRSMYGTYYNCSNLKGTAAINANVNNIIGTYYNCNNIITVPHTTENVRIMTDAFYNCTNLQGSPTDADLAISMQNTYYNCYLLEGKPANCNSAIVTTNAYYNCSNLYGDFYWCNESLIQADKINTTNMFYNRNYANKLNIWVKPETAIENALINYSDSFGNIYGVGRIDWTFFESTEGFDYPYYSNTLFNTNIILFFNKFLLGQFTPNDSFIQTDIKNNFPFGYGYYINYVSLGSNSSYNYRYDFTLYKNMFNIVSTSSEVPEGYTLLGYWSVEGRKNFPKVFMKQTNEHINYYSYSYRGRYYLNLFLNLKSIYVSLENLDPQEYWLPQNMNKNGISFFQDILMQNSDEPPHIDYFSYFNNKNLQHINTAILKGGNFSNPVNPIISDNVIYLGKQYVPYSNSYLDAYYSSGINYGWQHFKSFIQNNIIIEQVGNYIIPRCGINVATMDRTYEDWILCTLPVCGNNVKNMYGTYSSTKNCQKAIFGINVINAQNTYAYSDVTQNNIIFLGNNIIDVDNCFSGCYYLTHITQDDFAIDKCYHFNNTFLNCYNLIEFNAIYQSSSYQYKYSQHMFEDCHNLINFNSNFLGGSSVFYSGNMFMNCSKLFSCCFGDRLKVQRLESPISMFYNCYNLFVLDNHNDDTIYINYINGSMSMMFYNCNNLKGKIKVNYGNIVSIGNSFSKCNNLISINMPSYIASYTNNRDIDNNRYFTLSDCSNLIELNLGGLKIARSLIINNCDNLINISTSNSFYPLNLSLQISNCNNLQDINSLFKNRKSYVSYSISLANLPQLNMIDMNPIGNNYGNHSFTIYNMPNLFIKNTTFLQIFVFNNSIFYQNLLVDDDVTGLGLTFYQDYYVNNYSMNSFSNIEYIGNNLTGASLYCYTRNKNSNIPFISTESNSFQKLIDFSKNLYSLFIQYSGYYIQNLSYLFFLPNFTGENIKELQITVNNITDYYFNAPNFYYLNNLQNLSLPYLNITPQDNRSPLPNSLSISKINLKNDYLPHLTIYPGGNIYNNINNKTYFILNFLNNSFINIPKINILDDSTSSGAFYLHNTLPYNSLVPYFDMTLGLTANYFICRGSLPVAILLSNTSQSNSPLFHYHLTNLLSDKDIRCSNLYITNIFYYKYASTNFFNNNYYNEANLYQLFGENIYNCNIFFTNVTGGYDFNQYNFNLTYTNYYCNSLSNVIFNDDTSHFSIILPFIMYDNISDNGKMFGDTEWVKTKEIINSYSNTSSISPYNILRNEIDGTNHIAVLEYNWVSHMDINQFDMNNTISNRQIITYKEQWSNSAKNLNVIFYYRHMSADYALT